MKWGGTLGSGGECLGRRPALDGVRAVAVAAVIAQHLGMPWLANLGVLLFFTLSGFLITTLLLEEAEANGRVSLLRFWGRRALRLLPALAALVAVVGGYCLVVPGFLFGRPTLDGVPWVLGYAANWRIAGGHSLGLFQHLWSLAVEEQFYVVWPLLVVLLAAREPGRGRERAVLLMSVAGVLAVFVQRAVLMPGAVDGSLISRTDAVADQLLVGCALAAVWRLLHGRPLRWRRAVAWGLLGAAAAGHVWLAGAPVSRPFPAALTTSGGYVALALANAALIAHVVVHRGGPVARLLAWRPLVAVGRRSYGLYLWQLPAIGFVAYYVSLGPLVKGVVAVPLSLALAWLSFRFVEQPFLRRQERLRPAAAAEPAAAEPAPSAPPWPAPAVPQLTGGG